MPGFGAFGVIFGVAVVLILAGFVFVIVVSVRKYRVLKDAGHDPLTVDAALAARVLNSDLLSPGARSGDGSTTREQRLAELDDLFARGVITEAERATARAAVLGT